jgi:hypothetical protein
MSSAGDKHPVVTQAGAKMVLPYVKVKVKSKFNIEQASRRRGGVEV